MPSYIEIPNQKKEVMDNITSKIRLKLFKSNGQMRKQSPDQYTRRESHVQREIRLEAQRVKTGKKLKESKFKYHF